VYTGGLTLDPGFLRSSDGGGSWSKKDTGLDHKNFLRIVVDDGGHDLYLGTWGGGMFQGSDTWTMCSGGGPMSPPYQAPLAQDGSVRSYFLEQNSPNPFNPVTEITFGLPSPGAVSLVIYNVQGQRVKTLVAGPYAEGTHVTTWDGTDASGAEVASGVYFCRLDAGSVERTIRLVLMK
jgi:hypothetical protein